jgi:uncharacterized protein DUF6551
MTIPGEVSGRRYEVTELPANVLEVDPGVQRMLNAERVKKLADNFDESAVGILTVSARVSSDALADKVEHRYIVLDGQTRLAALRRFTGREDTAYPVICQVYRGLTRQEEAEIFLSHNDRAAVRTLDKFRLSIVAQEKWALDLERMILSHGFEIGRGARPERRFTAVAAARRILALPDGEDALNRAFDLLVRAWGHRRNTASAEALDGLGLLYQRHGVDVDTVGFAYKLGALDTPQTFKAGVLSVRVSASVSRTEAAYRYALSLYNKGRKTEARKLTARGSRS